MYDAELRAIRRRTRLEIAMWRARLLALWDRVLSRRLVGTDSHGNKYYIQDLRGRKERRIVEYRGGMMSTREVPVEWWAWLHLRRESPPTPEELARAARARESLAERVAALDAEDRKERLRGLYSPKVWAESPSGSEKHAILMQIASAQGNSASKTSPPSTAKSVQGNLTDSNESQREQKVRAV